MIRGQYLRRGSRGTLAMLLAALICVYPRVTAQAARQAPAVNQTAADPRFGATEAASQPDLADNLGVRWTRIPFIWRYVQPTGPSSWNPFVLSSTGSDGVIADEIARGRNVVGLLLGSPDWAARYSDNNGASVPKNIDQPWNPPASANPTAQTSWPATTNYWANYCYWLAKHYAGRIDQWIIWNEVDIPSKADGTLDRWTQWHAGTTMNESVHAYARLLEVAYQAIHAANPAAKLILYGDPYWYDKGVFLRTLLAQVHADDPTNAHQGFFDVANLHLYINAPTFYWIIGDLRRQLAQYGWEGKQVWVSETNVEPYDDPMYPAHATRFRVTMDEQAGFLVDAFAVDIAAEASRIEIYRMFDGSDTAPDQLAYGLISNRVDPTTGQHIVRPAGYTFHFLSGLFNSVQKCSYTPGALYPDPRSGGKAGVFTVVCHTSGARIIVLWNQLGAHPTYTAPFGTVGGVTYDAHNFIVLPARDRLGIFYDRYATATYRLPAHSPTATVYDKFGNAVTVREGQTITINNRNRDGTIRQQAHPTTISRANGVYTIQLRGGVTYSNPYDPRIPTVGGDPVIIVEPTGSSAP